MHGLRKTVVGITQVTVQGLRAFNGNPSNPAVQLKCVCGFKSVAKPVKRIIGRLEKGDSILHQHSQIQASLCCYGCNQSPKSISSIQRKTQNSIHTETASSLTGSVPLTVCRNSSDSLPYTPQSLPLLSYDPVLCDKSLNVFSTGFQFRCISQHGRRRNQRKRESRTLSTQKKEQTATEPDDSKEPEKTEEQDEAQLTLYQRFKKTYKEHGYVLVGVHVMTSAVWFGSFYTAARCGIDIVPYLESWNFSDRIISPFRSGGLGDVALAYLMYKLATPARYTVTLGGTNLVIRYLRKEGKMEPVPEGHSLRELYKEGKEDLKNRSQQRLNKIRRIRSRIRKRRGRHPHKDQKR